jgi:hypothetical protein
MLKQQIEQRTNIPFVTKLKAFGNAPEWTMEELKLIEQIFFDYGIHCVQWPKKLGG